jgi:hypothetical protein
MRPFRFRQDAYRSASAVACTALALQASAAHLVETRLRNHLNDRMRELLKQTAAELREKAFDLETEYQAHLANGGSPNGDPELPMEVFLGLSKSDAGRGVSHGT